MKIFALGCHPDDIEFMMAGTLLLLKEPGCELHYMNLANGSCGTTIHHPEEIVRIRRQEAHNAASLFWEPFFMKVWSTIWKSFTYKT